MSLLEKKKKKYRATQLPDRLKIFEMVCLEESSSSPAKQAFF